MNTINRITLTLFLAIFLVFTPNLASAQVDTHATSAQVDALRDTLIALLTEMITQLQAQITELIAEQAAQATQLGVVASQVDTVVANTTQPVPVITPAPLTREQQIEKLYKERFADCSYLSIPWSPTAGVVSGFERISSWFNSPERTDANRYAAHDAYDKIERQVRGNLASEVRGESVSPVSSFCSFSDSERNEACNLVLEFQTPYAQCMRGE